MTTLAVAVADRAFQVHDLVRLKTADSGIAAGRLVRITNIYYGDLIDTVSLAEVTTQVDPHAGGGARIFHTPLSNLCWDPKYSQSAKKEVEVVAKKQAEQLAIQSTAALAEAEKKADATIRTLLNPTEADKKIVADAVNSLLYPAAAAADATPPLKESLGSAASASSPARVWAKKEFAEMIERVQRLWATDSFTEVKTLIGDANGFHPYGRDQHKWAELKTLLREWAAIPTIKNKLGYIRLQPMNGANTGIIDQLVFFPASAGTHPNLFV